MDGPRHTMQIGLATCSSLPEWEVDDQPLVEALRRRGVRVHHPAWDDATFDFSTLDACLIRTTWDYEHRRDEFVRWARNTAEHVPFFNHPQVIEWNTHKSYLKDLAEAGVPGIPTEWIEKGEAVDLAGVLTSRGWTRGFLKPVVGSTARGTLRFHDDADSLERAQTFLDERLAVESMMVQPYLERVESGGEESIMIVDGEVTHAVRKVPVPGDYRVQDDFGASDEPMTPDPAEARLACRIMEIVAHRFGIDRLLYGRVDLLRDATGAPLLNELELVEPSFFFRHGRQAGDAIASAILARL
ncbi:MAG: hypothetical protein CMJ24_04520 [Phycisphaerae bacterium]|nr:hypothetical protein [Phycisphaerae bacterium]MDG1898650.1 hypothetical protein [Phycisphaerales bacterium]